MYGVGDGEFRSNDELFELTNRSVIWEIKILFYCFYSRLGLLENYFLFGRIIDHFCRVESGCVQEYGNVYESVMR